LVDTRGSSPKALTEGHLALLNIRHNRKFSLSGKIFGPAEGSLIRQYRDDNGEKQQNRHGDHRPSADPVEMHERLTVSGFEPGETPSS
jgi:hypothetical protein